MPTVWIDGRLVPASEATVPAVVPGVQVGLGVFESLAVVRDHAFAMTRHLARLAASAAIVGIEVPVTDAVLEDAIDAVIAAEPAATKMRVTVTSLGTDRPPTVVVNGVAQAEWPAVARVVVSPYVRNERAPSRGAKTTSYADNVLAATAARATGADEALLFDTRGHLSEGTASNVFVVVDGELCTPSLANGCLGGMTRELLCEIVPVRERDDLVLDDLLTAPEVFVTSSTRGVHPVASIDGHPVARCPGPLTEAAARAYRDLQARTLDP